MADHTTFGIGGPADLFYEAKNAEEVKAAVNAAVENGTPFFILGGGSNLLVADAGYRGLIIKIKCEGWGVKKNSRGRFLVWAEAGVNLQKLVSAAADRGLTGLEFAAGIPGTLGGAIRGNAGAWQQTIGDRLIRVQVFDRKKNRLGWLKKNECGFGYRTSRFKKTGEIILRAEFVLAEEIPATVKKRLSQYRRQRASQPKEPSAGCVFVNPKPEAAGRLIDLCRLKGVKRGEAQISPRHANFIVNLGRAKAADVLKLMNLARKAVKKKFGVVLGEEIQLVGFDKIG